MTDTMIFSDNTQEGAAALRLHYEIAASMAAAASAMVEFCRLLKQMRDTRYYEHLGFDSFENYVEQAHGIKQRQAYTYITTYEKLQSKLMEDNAQLGITKLSLLCQVSAVDREDFAQDHDLADITVEEFKKLIEEKNGLSEQVSLLTETTTESEDVKTLQDSQLEKLKTQLAEKNEELEKLKTELLPIDVTAVETAKLEAAIRQKELDLRVEFDRERAAFEKEKETLKRDSESALKKAEKQAAAAAKQDTEAKLQKSIEGAKAAAQEEIKKELTAEFEKRQSELTGSVAAAQAEAQKLEKQLKIAGNQNTVKFNILFEQVQQNILACLAIISHIEKTDTEMSSKLLGALRAVVDQLVGG